MKMLRVDTEEELSITSAETQPHNKKRKPAGFVIKPLPVYNQSLLDDHRAEKVARARVDTEESQLAINGRQKRTRYATAMLQNGEESAVRGQREQEMWERAALQNLFGIDTEEDELKEIKVSGQEMKMLKMESVAMTVLMMSGVTLAARMRALVGVTTIVLTTPTTPKPLPKSHRIHAESGTGLH
ncbi:hypothetical protein L915_00534 [Phytophthora nicotianae]|uniref:Uncharacterized protein n=1 Tax=Phytophthora nicotianae TaxID=4792 RepID=W2HNL8_PHYNI|nr:hypothetical protein L915_00534 [Phytophthora nicotianae]ETM56513.1 hypothetical protein L914_00528 [Phytophthora nicotianae]